MTARAADLLLKRAADGPAGLVVEGEAGIGKTTLLLRVIDNARAAGFRVLGAHGAQTEVSFAFAGLSDLLDGVDPAVLAELPELQRLALDRVLQRGGPGPATDERAVAAAFLAVLERQSEVDPVLLAVDDAHWLDSATRTVFGYAARRLTGRVAVLATVRTGETENDMPWLRLPRPDMLARAELKPLSLGGIHALISARLGHTLSRPTITRIHDLSGGNPFYALELSRALDRGGNAESKLPDTLAAVVGEHLGGIDADLHELLLLIALASDPTTDLIAVASDTGDPRDIVLRLEPVEELGILEFEGNHIRFSHPLLAAGVTGRATPTARRAAHSRLAQAVSQPELQARHLALACPSGDPATLQALDVAAMSTQARGAPATAAELLELAIGLGGDTPMRRMLAANNHFVAGDADRAQVLLLPAIASLPGGALRASGRALLAGICVYTSGFRDAAGHLAAALPDAADNPALEVHILLMLAFTRVNLGEHVEAKHHLDQAATVAAQLANDDITSQVLTMSVMLNCLRGNGIDMAAHQQALRLENPQGSAPIVFRASANELQLLAWAGDMDSAHRRLQRVWRQSVEKGAESELLFLAVHAVLIAIWRADLAEADQLALDAVERAEQLGGDNSLLITTTVQLAVAVYAGRIDDALRISRAASAAAVQSGPSGAADWPARLLAFLEVSQGRYAEAMVYLEPLVAGFLDGPRCTELLPAHFLPDAIEALTALGRLDEAESLIDALETNGTKLDRPWMLATGARGRAMWLAATGDLDAAEAAAEAAMGVHDRLPMPFERARTQLLLGQIRRRRRRKHAAGESLTAAAEEFEQIGARLWARRADAELARVAGTAEVLGLTPAEQRVADRAAAGLSNKQIAAELFISAKTVETNLSSVYRKLGIRSRAQLFARLQADGKQH